ncbi:MAG: hypothetical protein WA414_19470 [Acidobacteriaceae bacterium]
MPGDCQISVAANGLLCARETLLFGTAEAVPVIAISPFSGLSPGFGKISKV